MEIKALKKGDLFPPKSEILVGENFAFWGSIGVVRHPAVISIFL